VRSSFRTYVPAFASGAALVLCFPAFDLYPLAFVALVPFLVSASKMPAKGAFKAGFVLGVPYFFGTQYWIYHSINHYGGVPFALSLLVVLLLSLYLSLYTGLFGAMFSGMLRRSSLPALLVAPFFWVVLEFARSYVFTGFPWSSIGYSQYSFLMLIQFADITGVYGVSFLVLAVNGALADVFILRRRQEEMPLFQFYPVITGYILLFAAIAAALLYGNHRLAQVRPGALLTVTVVQGNIEQDIKWDPLYQNHVMGNYRDLTAAALRDEPAPPDMIIWPESALPFYFGFDQERTAKFKEFQRKIKMPLLVGAITVKSKEQGKYLLANSAVLLDPSREEPYTYDKIHLVPFGEYVPLKRVFFFLDKLVTGIGEYAPGENYQRASTAFGEFGTAICYEIIFPGLVRKFFQDGGDFRVTITNDAWFGRTAGPLQHWSMAVLRAVENRKPVIRAANTGVSGFIDSSGRIIAKTPIFKRMSLTSTVSTDRTRTLYSRYGDLFAFLCIIISVLLALTPRRK
jgi:apolipoprotein N-acyltransferase